VFEPLQALLNKHGDTFASHLSGIRESAIAIASNTEAQLTRNQSTRKSVPVAKGEAAQLRNDGAYGWKIKWVASTVKVRVFIGTETDDSFMLALEADGSERVDWYLPLNGIIFITTESEEGGFVNCEVEVLMTEAAEAHTGPSDERIEVERRVSEPDPQPLDVRT
jgi:hypothetical protein